MKKPLAAILSLFIFSNSAFAVTTFSDLSETTDYKSSIDWMAKNEVINGYADGSFKPENCVNRVEFLKMLFKTLKVDTTEYRNTIIFKDTPDGEWFSEYVKAAKHRGTVNGYSDGTFKPAQCVNRVEAIKMALLEFNDGQIPEYEDGFLGFIDIERNAWYLDYFKPAVRNNLVGTEHIEQSDNSEAFYFFPAASMTRKEVAEMLYRMKAAKDNKVVNFLEDMTPEDLDCEKLNTCKEIPEENNNESNGSSNSGTSSNVSSDNTSETEDYCFSWFSICFSASTKYYVFDFYDDGTPSQSQVVIAAVNNGNDLEYGDAFMKYAAIGYGNGYNDKAGYSNLLDFEADITDGNFHEFKILKDLGTKTINGNEFRKITVKGYGDSEYDYYIIEKDDRIYQFKSGQNEKAMMIDILETFEFQE